MPNFTPAQLLAELNTDPAAIGYAALIAAGNDAGVAALLNAPTTTSVYRNNIGVHEVVAAIAPADFAGLTTLQVAKLQLLFTGTTTIDASSANTRGDLRGHGHILGQPDGAGVAARQPCGSTLGHRDGRHRQRRLAGAAGAVTSFP
jgi:hypothetical protein